jgi:hypothetical protein
VAGFATCRAPFGRNSGGLRPTFGGGIIYVAGLRRVGRPLDVILAGSGLLLDVLLAGLLLDVLLAASSFAASRAPFGRNSGGLRPLFGRTFGGLRPTINAAPRVPASFG